VVGSRSEEGKVYIRMKQVEIAGMRKMYDLFEPSWEEISCCSVKSTGFAGI
jgi:hypothetical protein